MMATRPGFSAISPFFKLPVSPRTVVFAAVVPRMFDVAVVVGVWLVVVFRGGLLDKVSDDMLGDCGKMDGEGVAPGVTAAVVVWFVEVVGCGVLSVGGRVVEVSSFCFAVEVVVFSAVVVITVT